MLRALIAKDLRRVRRNPLPWLINLIVPLCMTALIGLAFGGKSDNGALGRIHFAVVDEDKTRLSDFLRGSSSQGDANKYLDPVFLDREEALREINDDKLAAVLIIPTNFTRHYLSGSEPVSLELIKNPAQSIHPAVMEEMLGALVTAMNALSRNFHSDFPELQEVIEGKGDYRKVSALIDREGDKLEALKKYVNPPLVSYEQEVRAGETKSGPDFNLFGYLLLGLAGMFLLFIANNAMTDLHRELRFRTFERYQTMRQDLLPFVGGKVVFTVVLLLLCSAVMLGGGGLLFRIHWPHPFALAVLTCGYACFAACLMAVLVAVVPDERRAGALNTITGMALGIAGGCAFPPQQLPAFLREHITPNLPSFWFADTARNLLGTGVDVPWVFVSIKLAVVSAVLIGLAAFLFKRRFKSGARA